jgi:hypothetical protein
MLILNVGRERGKREREFLSQICKRWAKSEAGFEIKMLNEEKLCKS